jgi:hypothetical protein
MTTPPALTVSRENIKVRKLFEDPSYIVNSQRTFHVKYVGVCLSVCVLTCLAQMITYRHHIDAII